MKIKEIFSKPISILKKINFRKIFKNKKSRRIFVIVLAAVVVFCVGLGAFIHSRSTSTKSENITSQVSRGSINNVIEFIK